MKITDTKLEIIITDIAAGAMLFVLVVLIFLILAMISPEIEAQPICSNLSPDQRAYCMALQQRNPGLCYSISNQIQREACRAEVSRNPSACSTIRDRDARNQCLVRSK